MMKKQSKRNFLLKPILATSLLVGGVVAPTLVPSTTYAAVSSYQTQMDGYTAKYVSFYKDFYKAWDSIEYADDEATATALYKDISTKYNTFTKDTSNYAATLNPEIQDIDSYLKTVLHAEFQVMTAQYKWSIDAIDDETYDTTIDKWTYEYDESNQELLSLLTSYRNKHGITYSTDFKDLLEVDVDKDMVPYTVQKGDTMYSIATKHGITVEDIQDANGLTTYNLSVGQLLVLPVPHTASPSLSYTVQKGDTLYSIAVAHGVTVEAIQQSNGMTNYNLSVGQVLIIPGSETPEAPVTTPPSTVSLTYTVQKGDTLSSIANSVGITVTELKELNKLTSDALSVGQVLKVTKTYTVQKGDTLYSIATAQGTTVEKLQEVNGLTSYTLSLGQVLIIK